MAYAPYPNMASVAAVDLSIIEGNGALPLVHDVYLPGAFWAMQPPTRQCAPFLSIPAAEEPLRSAQPHYCRPGFPTQRPFWLG